MNQNFIEIDGGLLVDSRDISAVETNGYWKTTGSPSGSDTWSIDGSRIILKNGRKVYTKLPLADLKKVLGIL